MSVKWLPATGELVLPSELVIPKAKGLVLAVCDGAVPYTSFVECRREADTHSEVVVLDLDVEVGQRTVYDIRRLERVAVEFDITDSTAPIVLALREDFPAVPHLNLRNPEVPRSLCLSEVPYDELKLHWTPTGIIHDIHNWLALTAKGKLHAAEQQLEPLLAPSSLKLIISPNLLSQEIECVRVHLIESESHTAVLIAETVDAKVATKRPLDFVAFTIQGDPQPHGVIRRQPRTLFELGEFLQSAHIDLLDVLKKRLTIWKTTRPEVLDAKLVILAVLPTTRTAQHASPERVDVFAFSVWETVKNIGIAVDLWEQKEGGLGYILFPDPEKRGQGITLDVLSPVYTLSPDDAAFFNGVPQKTPRIVQIGVGALGSQVLLNLARSGYGQWTIIDDDFLLPHNLARHALDGRHVGHPKAKGAAYQVNGLFPETAVATALVANVLHPGEKAGDVADALLRADVVLDCSASLAVGRYLATTVPGGARRISAYLNPTGTDLVVLVEDRERRVRLDWLEMEYYRFLVHSEAHTNHFSAQGSRRYGNSCRDISAVMSQELMSLHAAIASRAVRNCLENENESVLIWSAEQPNLSVRVVHVETHRPMEILCGEWTLKLDDWFWDKIMAVRTSKLPSETGGVLIGSIDSSRKIVYIVDTVLSPPDSQEWPTVYIRGCEGLKERVEGIQKRTNGMLQYVGEWHSHPTGLGCRPSSDDMQAFDWLVEHMAPTGMPALMMIAGDTMGWYLGRIQP